VKKLIAALLAAALVLPLTVGCGDQPSATVKEKEKAMVKEKGATVKEKEKATTADKDKDKPAEAKDKDAAPPAEKK